MTMMIFADHCVHADVVIALKNDNFHVVTAQQAGKSMVSDIEIFDHVKAKGYTLLTNDRGFGNMALFDIPRSNGVVIIIVSKMTKETIITNVLSFFKSHTQEDIQGGLCIIEAGRVREIKR